MKKVLLFFAAMLSLSVASAASGVDWSQYAYLGDGAGGGQYSNQFKVQKVDGINEIVNIQRPGFADEAGIYMTTNSGISACSVGSAIQGAGIVLYLSSFTAKETEVSITNAGGQFTFWVYNDKGTEGSTEPETPGVVKPGAKFTVTTTATTASLAYEFTNEDAFLGVVLVTDENEEIEDNPYEITGLTENTEYTYTFYALGIPAPDPNDIDNMGVGDLVVSDPIVVTFKTQRNITLATDTHESAFNDENVAKNCPVYYSEKWGGEIEWLNDDAIGGAFQLQVNNAQPVEWFVVDLGFKYDVTKIQLVTTGDRKDKLFAIYTATAQAVEPEFANGTMAIADADWTLAFYAEDDFENNGVVYHSYAVNLEDVRYIKYVGVERNHTDIYGVGVVEFRVAGTTNDDAATVATAITLANKDVYFENSTEAFGFTIENAVGAAIEFDPALLSVTTSDAEVATAAIDGSNVVLTCVAAGDVTITIQYGELSQTATISVKPALIAAPVPTYPAADVLSLYSDTYTGTRNFNWYDWGGCKTEIVTIDGNNMMHAKEFHYLGSQFMDDTDVTGYQYFHVDIYPTASTTIGIIPITHVINGEGGRANAPERGATVDVTAFKWNSIDVKLSDFEANGVINFDHIYQIKYNLKIQGADQWNADGTFDVYFDNVFFYNPGNATAIESIDVDNAAAVYYNLQGVRVDNPTNGLYIKVVGNKTSKVFVK